MKFKMIAPDKSISLFVKSILVFQENNPSRSTSLPFYADGYPGLMYQETDNGLLVNPHRKMMPGLFLYGQTVKPIELEMKGRYSLIVFQLYPFVLRTIFGLSPKSVTDDCFNLEESEIENITSLHAELRKSGSLNDKIGKITSLLYHLFMVKRENFDYKVIQAVQFIFKTKGQENVTAILNHLKMNERTLERRFLNEVGLSPKKFSKIIQFQLSLEQLTLKDFTRLTDIVYKTGFTDQSHFIKVFKAFTGKTPKGFSARK